MSRPVESHASPPVAAPERFGSYLLTSLVGGGAMSLVHRARFLGAGGEGSECAVKRLQRHRLKDAELRKLLVDSARAAAAVASPHVVRILEVREEPEPYVAMEYVDGWSLQAVLAAAPRADRARFLVPLFVDVLAGLHALHEVQDGQARSSGLVHCAPSARHVLIGRDGIARLADLTHVVSRALPWSPRRDERLLPHEMAPEQALAPAHLDARCDVFILGMVLWEALTGRSLFRAASEEGSLQCMLRGEIAAPSAVGSTAGRGFDRICLRALQRARAGRYRSAAEMGVALRDELEQSGGSASRAEIATWMQSISSGASSSAAEKCAGADRPPPSGARPSGQLPREAFRPSRPPRTALHPEAPARMVEPPSGERALGSSTKVDTPDASTPGVRHVPAAGAGYGGVPGVSGKAEHGSDGAVDEAASTGNDEAYVWAPTQSVVGARSVRYWRGRGLRTGAVAMLACSCLALLLRVGGSASEPTVEARPPAATRAPLHVVDAAPPSPTSVPALSGTLEALLRAGSDETRTAIAPTPAIARMPKRGPAGQAKGSSVPVTAAEPPRAEQRHERGAAAPRSAVVARSPWRQSSVDPLPRNPY